MISVLSARLNMTGRELHESGIVNVFYWNETDVCRRYDTPDMEDFC